MKPNIHQFPEAADQAALLAYKIAVMQAYADGGTLEIRLTAAGVMYPHLGSMVDAPLNQSWVACSPPVSFNWTFYDYRIAAPKIAEGHNPAGITNDQVEVALGWRLLAPEEIGQHDKDDKPGEIVHWLSTERWSSGEGDHGWYPETTYRTKAAPGRFLPKPKVAEGHNPAKLTVDQIGAGFRTLSLEEAAYLQDASKRDNTAMPEGIELYGGEWKPAPWCGDSPTRTYRTQKPSGFYLPKPKLAPGEVCGRGPTVNVNKGHNPENLTAQDLEADKGWRLLSLEEHAYLASLTADRLTRRLLPLVGSDLECRCSIFCGPKWETAQGGRHSYTYRTRKPAGWYTAAAETTRDITRRVDRHFDRMIEKAKAAHDHATEVSIFGCALHSPTTASEVFEKLKAEGHNPLHLTNAEVGVSEGWRLLSTDEVKHRASQPGIKATRNIQNVFCQRKREWSDAPARGDRIESVYRTKLPAGHFLPRPKPTTVRGWLETLPAGYRERALRNLTNPGASSSSCLKFALSAAFIWSESPEGRAFWDQVYEWDKDSKANKLPALPKP